MLVTYIIGSLPLIVKPGPDLTCTIATALADGKSTACLKLVSALMLAAVVAVLAARII